MAAGHSHRVAEYRFAAWGCLCVLVGALLSGPGAMLLVALTHPQPAWRDAQLFAAEFHQIQALPYFLGLILVFGFVALISSLNAMAQAPLKAQAGCALVLCGVGAALIFHNYVLQTTFLPTLARNYVPANAALIGALTMANPSSLAWGLEMWGYGFIGVATWLVAPVFAGSRLARGCAWAFRANGWMSVAGALWTAFSPGWVMTAPGLVAFSVWNALVVAMVSLAFFALRREARAN